MRAFEEDGALHLRVAGVVDGRPYADDPVALAWYAVDDARAPTVAALPGDAAPIGEGPAPSLPWPPPGPAIGLVARSGDAVFRAVLPVGDALGDAPQLAGIEVRSSPLRVADVQAADLALDARRALQEGEPTATVDEGGFARLIARGVPADGTVRWMSTAPGGTFFELDGASADWAAGRLLVDDDEIEEATAGPAGPRTVLALALGPAGDGANAWAARELWVGPAERGVFTASGRWIGTDADVSGPFVRGTLVADDAAPTGLALVGAETVADATEPGTAALPCAAPVSGPFDPDWLLTWSCTRDDVVGATVVVQVAP